MTAAKPSTVTRFPVTMAQKRPRHDDQAVGIAKELMRFNIPIERIVAATVNASNKITRSYCAGEMNDASKTDTPY